jgi:hypothetical protein
MKGKTSKKKPAPRVAFSVSPPSAPAARASGDDLFPWPCRVVSTLSAQTSLAASARSDAEPLESLEGHCRQQAQAILGTEVLPPTRHFELYLIRGITQIILENSAPKKVVAFPPEFLFILDVGYDSLVGVTVPWNSTVPGIGNSLGDAHFPDMSQATLRSLPDRAPAKLIYPDVTGELMLGIALDVTPEEARRKLSQAVLKDIEISGTMATAKCKPFRERPVCTLLQEQFGSVVRYASPNHVVRLVDLPWTVIRLC